MLAFHLFSFVTNRENSLMDSSWLCKYTVGGRVKGGGRRGKQARVVPCGWPYCCRGSLQLSLYSLSHTTTQLQPPPPPHSIKRWNERSKYDPELHLPTHHCRGGTLGLTSSPPQRLHNVIKPILYRWCPQPALTPCCL